MQIDDLISCTASEIAALIRTKQVSPVEVTSFYLNRIEALNPEINAFITQVPENAMTQAHRAESAIISGDPIGPLHGVPIGIKDLNPTKDILTTYGSILFGENIPTSDDIVVERIKSSGAIIVGKTNTPDFGWKGTTESTFSGATRNPWDTNRTSGGSSGGSAAAVAARMVPISNGGDAGGSIRIPASFCGIYGIKPSFGRVPYNYQPQGSWSPLSQNGPMTLSVHDAAVMLNAISGPDGRDPRSINTFPPDFTASTENIDIKNLKIAWAPNMDAQPVDPQVQKICGAAMKLLAGLGADVDEITPRINTNDAIWAFAILMLTDLSVRLGPIIESGQGDFLPSPLSKWITEAISWPGAKYSSSLHELEWHKSLFDDIFSDYDLIAMPTMAVPAFPIEKNPDSIDGITVDPNWGFTPFCIHANLTGRPAANIPCGYTVEGLPVGLMLMGHINDEITVLKASAAFELAQPWKDSIPSIISQ